MARPPRTADVDSLVELLGAVAEAIDPATAEAAYPLANPDLLCVLVMASMACGCGSASTAVTARPR